MAQPYERAIWAARYLDEPGRHRGKWRTGITDDPEVRLFTEHDVDPTRDDYAWVMCANDGVAREAERMLLDAGYDGGPGGGTGASRFVYVFKIS